MAADAPVVLLKNWTAVRSTVHSTRVHSTGYPFCTTPFLHTEPRKGSGRQAHSASHTSSEPNVSCETAGVLEPHEFLSPYQL